MNRILVLLLLLTTAVSCGKKSTSEPQKPEVDAFHARPLEVTQVESVHFTRKEQWVNEYDCSGSLISRKLKTQNNLSKKITIDYEKKAEAWSYSVYNRRTKSRNKGIAAVNGNIMIDYAPTMFFLHVNEGLNDVEYMFFSCSQIGKDVNGHDTCVGVQELMKEGIVQIDVGYSSVELPGEQNIHPAPESCKKI